MFVLYSMVIWPTLLTLVQIWPLNIIGTELPFVSLNFRSQLATDAINSRIDIDEYVNEHRPTVPPPPRARYESHDGIIREITESIMPSETPRSGGKSSGKKGIFGKKQPKTVCVHRF